MKTVQLELSGDLAVELDNLIKGGWFASESEIMRLALVEFVARHRFELAEKFQRDDIAWALKQKTRLP